MAHFRQGVSSVEGGNADVLMGLGVGMDQPLKIVSAFTSPGDGVVTYW
jgi:hypothetical protein